MNFFLYNEAISIIDYDIFLNGLLEINSITQNEKCSVDTLMKHSSVWELDIVLSYLLTKSGAKESAIINFITQLQDSEDYLTNSDFFDAKYPNSCNGFLGIDFSQTDIEEQRQICSLDDYNKFSDNCRSIISYDTVENFWNKRSLIFPDLVFCTSVYDQISNYSINDDRFKAINKRLEIINRSASNWTSRAFNFKTLGLNNSPDTATRKKNTIALRTIDCPNIGAKVFDYHVKWSVGGEVFRLYYYPSTVNYKIYIGYIGDKSGIGF